MADRTDRELAQDVIEENRYLTLATTDGDRPWIAPVEYVRDDAGTFYFFSPEDSRHARHIARNERVAVAIFSADQPEYSADGNLTLNGVQFEGVARKLSKEEHPALVVGVLEALQPPTPPYAAFEIEPGRFYVPKVEQGVNTRAEVAGDT